MRRLAIARAIYGAVLLVASDTIVERVSGERSSRAATVGRVLGARHVLQAVALGGTRSRGWVIAGMVADSLHALSMVAFAARSDHHRRLAVLDAAAATSWAVGEWASELRS